MEKVLVLYVERFDYTSKISGNQVKGARVMLSKNQRVMDAQHVGVKLLEVRADHGIFMDLEAVPGVYEVDWSVSEGFQGKLETSVGSLHFVHSAELVVDGDAVPLGAGSLQPVASSTK